MSVFADYARYYNLLYQDKDYACETAFVLELLQKYGGAPKTLLDLGCGTGRHAQEMAKKGIAVTGVDMSENMLDMGNRMLGCMKVADFPAPLPALHRGDARTVRLGAKFDAVVSLFHVMSYQNTEEDALALMITAKEHLSPGGMFLYDFWYGPGVLNDPPQQREKLMEDAKVRILRKAVPDHRVNDNRVDVHYSIHLTDKATGQESDLNECHPMRYWFLPELRHIADRAGFTVLGEGGWLFFDPPQKNSWNAWALSRVTN